MINILLLFFIFMASTAGAMFGCWLWSKRKWSLIVSEDPKTREKILELAQNESLGKVEFLADPTAEELEEMAKPAWSKFLSQFKIKK